MCESCSLSIRYHVKSEQNVRQDLIPRVRHAEGLKVGVLYRRSQKGLTVWQYILTLLAFSSNQYYFRKDNLEFQ